MNIDVQVVYALADRQHLIELTLPGGSTAIEAVRRSGLLGQCAELTEAKLDLGIYAEPVAHNHVLVDGDRVEIYRPLSADPRTLRRRRAERMKS